MQTKRLGYVVALGLVLILALLGLLQTARAAPDDLFAKPDGSGIVCTQANPCTLQTALAQAAGGDIIFAAGGTYTGTGDAVITVTKSITLYGGWDGTTATLIGRNPHIYVTTLDGENARRVIHIDGDITPTLDGFTVTGGDASNVSGNAGRGGGIYCCRANAIITNNVITNNVANTSTTTYGYGGGMYLLQSGATVSGNTIISNTASTAGYGVGGGLYLRHSNATVNGNTISGNTAGADSESRGGGLGLERSAAIVSGNMICENSATTANGGSGGGIRLFYSNATVDGNTIISNTAAWGAGGLKTENCDFFTVTNNIIAQNHGASGVFAWAYISTPSHGVLVNNTIAQNGSRGVDISQYSTLILTNNIVASHTTGIYAWSNATNTVVADYTLFFGNTNDTGGGVITSTNEITGSDPAFVDPDNGNYHLGPSSAAIDAGVVVPWLTTDIDGDARPIGPSFDIGADEARWRRVYLPLVLKNLP